MERANIYRQIRGIFLRLQRDAQSDWICPWGIHYKDLLADEILQAVSDKRTFLDSETIYDLLRVCPGLKNFELICNSSDSTVYTADELISEIAVLLYNLAPVALANEKEIQTERESLEGYISDGDGDVFMNLANGQAIMRHPEAVSTFGLPESEEVREP